MSFYFAACFPDRVEVVTDGAVYDERGVLHSALRKVYPLEGAKAVVSARGVHAFATRFSMVIQEMINLTGSLDGAMAALEEYLPQMKREDAPYVDIVIAGISESRGPITFWFETVAHDAGVQPWKLYTSKRGFMCGNEVDAADHARLKTLGGLEKGALPLMEWARRQQAPNMHSADRELTFFIGGHVDLTTVTAAGAHTKRIHTWDDQVGKPIDPFANEPNVISMGLNRQQRRALKKQQKGRAA